MARGLIASRGWMGCSPQGVLAQDTKTPWCIRECWYSGGLGWAASVVYPGGVPCLWVRGSDGGHCNE